MSGLRFQDISPFLSGRAQRIDGTSYARYQPIPLPKLVAIKHLDALISQGRILIGANPFTGVEPENKQLAFTPVHVPAVERALISAFGGGNHPAQPLSNPAPEPKSYAIPEPPAGQGDVPVPDGTVEEVLAWVGADVDRAALALDYERAHKNRSTLVTALETLLGAE